MAIKRCFIIMPYGGNDEQMRKRFEGVYQTIICPAARNAGYEPKRSDIAGEPGNITQDIIRDLAESEVVIADLTMANANVFFELGIRHAFRKSGTVHIVDGAHSLPFDVRQYRAIAYTTELAEIPEVQKQIEDAIGKRVSQPDRADNPVHDAIPELPLDIRASGERAVLDQLKAAQENSEKLRQENEKLVGELAELKPAVRDDENGEIDIDTLLDRAENTTVRLKVE